MVTIAQNIDVPHVSVTETGLLLFHRVVRKVEPRFFYPAFARQVSVERRKVLDRMGID